jgi:TolA-binding protein
MAFAPCATERNLSGLWAVFALMRRPSLTLFLALLCAPAVSPAWLAERLDARQAHGLAAEAWRARVGYGPGADAAAHLRLAESLLRSGQAARAALQFEAWTARHGAGPHETRALLGLARARVRSGQYQAAVEAVRQARTDGSASGLEAALLEADALFEAGRYQEADAAYGALEGRPGLSALQAAYLPYARGWSQFRLGQLPVRGDADGDTRGALKKAAGHFARAAAVRGSRYAVPSQYQQGESLYALGDWEGAAKAYLALEKGHDQHDLAPAARYSLAWCRFEQGRYKDAATAYHRFSIVHAEHPLAAWSLYLAGVSLARAGDYDLAESAYALGLRKYPGSDVADRTHYGLAWLATARKDAVAASAEWTRFLRDWPQSPLAPSATFLLADALYQEKRYASAREQYLVLLKRYPQEPLAEDALFYGANASLALGELAQASDEFQQFLRLRPKSGFATEARLRLADCHYGLGKLEAAEEGYSKLRTQAKEGRLAGEASLGLGWVSFSRKDWGSAALRFRQAAQDLSGAPQAEAWLRAGDASFNAGQHTAAQTAYRQAAQASGHPRLKAEAHLGAGWSAYRLRDFGQAYGEWGNARALAPDDGPKAEASYWMGWALFRQARWAEAAQAFGDLASRWPGSHLLPDALTQQGNSLQNAGRCEDALPLYRQVADGWPQHPKAAAALHGLQICYSALGRDDEAVALAKDFVKKHAGSAVAPQVQYQVAEHYLARKDYAKAERELDALKTAYPKSTVDITATYWRGEARFKNLRFNQAVQDWRDVVARAPEHPLAPRALFRSGLAWYRLQEYGQAESTFRQVLDAYGNTLDVAADARFNLGLTYKRMGRDADAVAAYEEVAAKHPDTELAAMARIRIGYIYEDARDYDRAAAAYRALAASDKGRLGAEAQYLVGDTLLAQKKTGEALLAYDTVLNAFPEQTGWGVTALAKSGELLESLGRDKEALERYERIVKVGGDPAWTRSAKKRIELIKARLAPPSTAAPKTPAPRAGQARQEGAP